MRQKHLILSLLIVMLFGNYGYASYLELMRKYGYFNAQPPAIQAVSNIATTATPFPYGSYTNPQGQYADGMNLYQYVRSNPVKNVDSFGLQAFPFIYMQPAPPRRCGNCGPDITSKIDALNKNIAILEKDNLAFKDGLRLLIDEREKLQAKIARLIQAKTALEAQFLSVEELKIALKRAKSKKRQEDRLAKIAMLEKLDEIALRLGNRGYMIKEGQTTFKSPRIRVQLEPIDKLD